MKLNQLRRTFGKSLQAQAVAANFLPVAAATALVLVMFGALLFVQLSAFYRELELRSQSLADSLARQSELAALLGDRGELERICRTVAGLEDIVYVGIEGPQGQRLVEVTAHGFGAADFVQRDATNAAALSSRHPRTGERFLDVVAVIRNSDPQRLLDWEAPSSQEAPLGVVRLGISAQKHHSMYQRSLLTAAALGLASLCLILSVQLRQMRRILAPLKSLIGFTRDVAGGDLSKRAVVVRNDEVGDLTVACNEMVCELEQSHTELVEALDSAHEASRLKSQFLANMSHEIRTPLNGVIGMTELALDYTLPDEARDQLSTALNSAQTLLVVLNDILDLSKIEAGRLDLDCIAFDLEMLMKEVVRTLAVPADRKGLKLVCDVSPKLPRRAAGDPDRLRQVLTNLIGNAVKFTSEGKITVSASLLSEADAELVVAFSVTDTGIGIPDDKLATIFEAFQQADGSMTRQYGGTGLGLTICERLVQMMGGRIVVCSEKGVGSTFRFTARLGRSKEADSAGAATTPQASADVDGRHQAARQALSILVVEDNHVNRKVLESVLLRQGHRVHSVQDGLAAVEEYASRSYDLILMDVQMPRMNGWEATRRIREEELSSGNHVPIIALTAHALKGDKDLCLRAGMDGYVTKPIIRAQLFEAIDQATRIAA